MKAPTDYRIVGTSVPRVDIPAKLAGDAVFVHDVRVPGMLHGRVVRPPYAGVGRTVTSSAARCIGRRVVDCAPARRPRRWS